MKPSLVYEIRADILCPKGVFLSSITDAYLSNLATLGFDAIWVLGVWTRSPAALQHATKNLPQGMPRESAAASLFAVIDYHVDPAFGGDDALKIFKVNCNRFGLSLLIDFVSNHFASDHWFVRDYPELLEQGGVNDKGSRFFSPSIQSIDVRGNSGPAGGEPIDDQKSSPLISILCHGRDAFGNVFADTVQIKHRSPQSREALLNTLLFIASSNLADGVRCDMANHLSSDVIKNVWGPLILPYVPTTRLICAASGSKSIDIVSAALTLLASKQILLPSIDGEFWTFSIARVKALFPSFVFIGEWCGQSSNTDSSVLFDFVCDRNLAISLTTNSADGVLQHLRAAALFERKEATTHNIKRRATFCENHETNRVAAISGGDLAAQACAVIALAPPSGLRIIHDGQLSGRKLVHPVLIGPRDNEKASFSMVAFYHNFLPLLKELNGSWHIASITPSRDGNSSWRSLVAFFITPISISATASVHCDKHLPILLDPSTSHSAHEQSESASGSTITDSSSSSPTSPPTSSSAVTFQVKHIQQVSSLSSTTNASSSTSGGGIASDFKVLSVEPGLKAASLTLEPVLTAVSLTISPDSAGSVVASKTPPAIPSSPFLTTSYQRLPPTFLVICNISSCLANGHVLFSRADECAYSSKSGEQAVLHIQNLAREAGSEGSVLFVDRLTGGVSASLSSSSMISEGLWIALAPFEKRILEIVVKSDI